MKRTASFSSCKDYRWSLTRKINDSKKELIFIGLNPSYANSSLDDPTLRRLIGFSKLWGYGSLVVINLFARISKSPRLLALCDDPVGWNNDFELNKRINYWSRNDLCELWIGWGVNGNLKDRNKIILKRIKKSLKHPCVIGLTKEGHPKHPLYISKRKSLSYLYLKDS